MAMKFVVIISSLMVAMVIAQQRPVPPQFSRSGAGRGAAARLELEPQQTVPQPFRRVSLPLYRGRGFSLQDGQDPKSIPAITQLPPFQPRPAVDNNNNNNNNELNRVGDVDDETAVDALPQTVRSSQIPQQQVDRTQQIQQFDRTQQQPEKQFNSFRPQIQTVETQPHYVRKVVQRPLKRPQVVDDSIVTSRSPETVQKLKLERLESADKQRAKKPVSQVLRRYRDDNPDGSITWGFENDDGTFKEETIGVDCVTRGKYGYVDPEGVKREYSYQSGIPCDKNRNALQPEAAAAEGSAVQEAQASDKSYGYIDYSKNQYVMANGQTINLNGMARNRARKQPVAVSRNKLQPVANVAGAAAQPTASPTQQLQRFGRAEQRRNNNDNDNNNNNNNKNYYF